jgi:hypothetical protein
METQTKLPRNKPMIFAGFSFYALFGAFFILKNHLLNISENWSSSPIFDDVFMLGFGVCLSVLFIGYTYYAWTLNLDDFVEWINKQVFVPKKQAQKPISDLARSNGYWLFRIVSPIGAFFGIASAIFSFFSIAKYLLK